MPRTASARRLVVRDFSSSLLFDGANSTVIVPHNANQLLTTGMTLSAWINPFSVGETSGRIVDKSTSASATGGFNFVIASTNNRLSFQVNGGTSIISSLGSLTFKRWQHAIVTVASDATVTFYINGVISGTPAATGALSGITTTNALTIGNRSSGTDRTFDGLIDEVCIWNRVLTTTEIADLYYGGTISTSGLIGKYLFNEGAGTVANDTSASANNGTITSAVFSADIPIKSRKVINGNLVKNGSFEYAPPFVAAQTSGATWNDGTSAGSSTNSLFGWGMGPGGQAGSWSVRYDNTVSHSGAYSMKLSTTAVASQLTVGNIVASTAAGAAFSSPVQPNTTYNLTFWMKTNYVSGDSNDGAFVIVRARNVSGTTANSATSTKVKTTTDWNQYTVQITTAATAVYIDPQMSITGSSGTATLIMDAWFDDISLTPAFPEQRLAADGNLVKNPGFEVAPTFVAATTSKTVFVDGTTTGSSTNSSYKWAYNSNNSAGSGSVQFDPSTSNSGVGSLKVSTLATGVVTAAGSSPSTSLSNSQAYSVRAFPSTSYTYSFWVKTQVNSGSATSGAYMQFSIRNGDVSSSTSFLSTKINTTGNFTNITGTFTTSSDTAFIDYFVIVKGNDGAATLIMDAWFDDIDLRKTTASRLAA